MRILRYFIIFCVVAISSSLSAQSQKELGQFMRERNEYYFNLTVDKPTEIQTINEICSVDGVKGHTVVCYANQKQYEMLLKAGYQPVLQTPPCMLDEAVMWDGSNRASYEWDSYPTYDAYQSMMEAFPAQAQETGNRSCTLLDLGTLNSGRKILGVRLNNGQPDGKPKFLYSSTMHGDEVTGMMLMLRLIDEFCTSTDTRIINLLDNLDIFILPLTNPDGTYYGGNSTMNSARRYNINGVDLNRNYKDYHNGDHPDGNSYALETQWTMQLAQDYLFTMSANYHGGAEVANYPWDAIYDRHPDDAWFQYVCLDYVNRARAINSSYMTDTESSGITNGADWYVITGSRQDYENAYGECREITMECSSTKKPAASLMPTYWSYNHDALLGLMEQCLNGVHGFVYDAVTGEALQGVTVNVENHDTNLSHVTTHSIGDFHRPIKGGTYTLTFTKSGYYPESVQVTVADGQRVELNNVLLTPDYRLIPEFTATTTNAFMGQSLSFTDASIGMITSWNWIFEGATPSTSTDQNPTGITYETPGDYDVTLTIVGPTGDTATLTKENYIHVSEGLMIGDGTEMSQYLPSFSYYTNSLTEQIYTSDELGSAGLITSISFYNGGAEKSQDYDFYMKATSKSSFSSKTDWIAVSAADKVFSGTVIMVADDWTTITFSTPFVYDGISNVVLVTDKQTQWSTSPHLSCLVFDAPNQALYIYDDNTDYDPLSPPTTSSSYNNVLMSMKNQILVMKSGFDGCMAATPTNVEVGNITHSAATVSWMGYSESYNVCLGIPSIATLVDENFAEAIPAGWDNSSDYPWTIVDGHMESGNAGVASSASSISATVTFASNGTIEFDAECMGEGTSTIWDKCLFMIDGVQQFSYGANVSGWNHYSYDVTTGDHTFTWTYSKDSSVNPTGDYFAVDNVVMVSNECEWTIPISVEDAEYTFTGLTPSTDYCVKVQGVCDGTESAWSEMAYFTTEELTEATQTIALLSGQNWFSTYLDITLDDLKDALVATGNTSIVIKSKTSSTNYNGVRWRGNLNALDVTQMYMIQVETPCEIELTSLPLVPSEHPITIKNGPNWIGFPLNANMNLTDAFAGFAVNGDVIKSKTSNSTYNGIRWRGNLTTLEPGQGYMYNSSVTEDRIFTFPSSAK